MNHCFSLEKPVKNLFLERSYPSILSMRFFDRRLVFVMFLLPVSR